MCKHNKRDSKKNTEIIGQRSDNFELRMQNCEKRFDGEQVTEDRWRKAEDGGQRAEGREGNQISNIKMQNYI